jgi:hypothetical protein
MIDLMMQDLTRPAIKRALICLGALIAITLAIIGVVVAV